MRSYVTVASDASYREDRSGFAYYIRDDSGTTGKAWRGEKGVAVSSNHAEIIAMVHALEEISQRVYPPNTKLIYYCDNMTVFKIISNTFTTTKAIKRWQDLIHTVQYLTRDMAEVEVRHVKAHVKKGEYGVEPKKFYMNRWCDANAYKMMSKGRYSRLYKEIK